MIELVDSAKCRQDRMDVAVVALEVEQRDHQGQGVVVVAAALAALAVLQGLQFVLS